MLDGIGPAQWIIAAVAVQRLAELALARRNTARLLSAGGVEAAPQHYPWLVGLHGVWLLAIALTAPPDGPVIWPLVALFAVLQVARIWVIASLGRFWTTRIITLPGAPLVAAGPYRYVRHPNYWIVAAEIAILPLAFGLWPVALGFSLANAALLRHRIRAEEAALAPRRSS